MNAAFAADRTKSGAWVFCLLRLAYPMVLLLMACTPDTSSLHAPPPDPPAAPWIPPHCYVRNSDGQSRNPCYVCHQRGQRPHSLDDSDLQVVFDFPEPARRNGWSNLFADRSAAIAKISDDEIDTWVATANTIDHPWGQAGWQIYNAPPIPGYSATHGSWGDTFIRLPLPYRTDAERYALNLAVLDAVMAREDIPIPPTNEAALGQDLDLDGNLGTAHQITYRFTADAQPMGWVADVPRAPTPGLFPEGTEILHSVRYLDPTEPVQMAPRMKELRYMVKTRWLTMAELASGVASEEKERRAFPDRLEPVLGDAESGVSNGRGWRLNGFIEDEAGALRPQTTEELASCVGCHGGVGRTVDSVFSYPRRRSLAPVRGDGEAESALWQRLGGGRHFGPPVDSTPTPERARAMNKAYRVIVAEQSFAHGREAVWGLNEHQMWREVPPKQATGVSEVVTPAWIQKGK